MDLTGITGELVGSSLEWMLAAKNAAESRVATILVIIVKVLPRPIPSASIPPRISSGVVHVDPVIMCLCLISVSDRLLRKLKGD